MFRVGENTQKAPIVILPCLNEPYLPTLKQKLKNYKIDVRTEHGLSHAVWKGVFNCENKIIVVMDADGSHPPEVIPNMLKLLSLDTWLIVGSRYVKGGFSKDRYIRQIISRIYCLIAQISLRTKIKDCMSGFYVGYRNAFQFTPNTNFKFGLQLIRKNKGHIKEYPIVFEKRKGGKSKIKPLQAVHDFIEIFKGLK